MDIKALAQKYEPYIIERRRYFHAHPELSFKEWETTKALVAEFEKMGMEIHCQRPQAGCGCPHSFCG